MEIKYLTKDGYEKWDDFCSKSDDAWYWHTTDCLEFNLYYTPEFMPESKSFYIKKDNKIIAICPLIIVIIDGVKEFSFGGGYGILPAFINGLTKKDREKIMKFTFKHIDNLAKEFNIKKASFRFSVLNKSYITPQSQRYNHLVKYGYLDVSINTQVIDLEKTLKELRGDIRHGHNYDINRVSKILKIEIFDYKNITREIFDRYKNLHHKAMGRVTRPKITFDLMYKAIKKQQAVLVGAIKDKKFVGFSYFYLYKGNAYYGSSCNDPDFRNIPISHAIQWRSIEYLKNKGYHYYELGWQQYGPTLVDFPTSKAIDIARFKRGFGGFTVPLFMGEKYYNRDYFLKIYNKRVRQVYEKVV